MFKFLKRKEKYNTFENNFTNNKTKEESSSLYNLDQICMVEFKKDSNTVEIWFNGFHQKLDDLIDAESFYNKLKKAIDERA